MGFFYKIIFIPPLTPPSKGGEKINSSPCEGEVRRGFKSLFLQVVSGIIQLQNKN